MIMLGKQTIDGVGMRPSDHLGLVAHLRVQTPGRVSTSASAPVSVSVAAPIPAHQASKPTAGNSVQATLSKKRSQPQSESGSSAPALDAEALRLKRLRRFESTKKEQEKPKTEPNFSAFLGAPSPSSAAKPCVDVIDLT